MLEHLQHLMAALHRNDDEPWPGDEELHGARGARGTLLQWTCDDGVVLTDPPSVAPPPLTRWDTENDRDALAHIGQPCTCIYAIRSDRSALAYVQFDDGVRCYVYTSDCVFD